MLLTKRIYFRVNLITDATRLLQTFFVSASKLGRIWKRPVQSCSHTRENRASFCFGLAANCNHIGKYVARRLANIEDGLR